MTRELLKLAAHYLEDSREYIDSLETDLKKSELIEKIAHKLKNDLVITTIDDYFEKVAELKEKGLDELENMNTYLHVYAPQAQAQFGKLAEHGPKVAQFSSAEDQFKNIIFGGN